MSGTKEWLVIENDGELDLRLLELMGASVKEGDDPIGVFGTGWKYGIALALRKKMSVVIFSSQHKIEFSKITEVIRGEKFHRIAISVDGKRRRKTSMTTRMGSKDWDDEWMFLREVASNAFDEGGFQMRRAPIYEGKPQVCGEPGKTRVYMTFTPRLEEVLDNMSLYIRRNGEIEDNSYGRIMKPLADRCRIYKKGIFVKELPEKSVYDYDITNLKLTESRSADHWDIVWALKDVLNASSLGIRRRIVGEMKAAKMSHTPMVESDLHYDSYLTTESQEMWEDAFNEEFGEDAVLCDDSDMVIESVKSMGHAPVTMPEKVANILRKGKKVKTDKAIVGVGAAEGYAYRSPSSYEQKIIAKGLEVMGFVFGDVTRIPVKVFKSEGINRSQNSRILEEADKTYSLLLNEDVFDGGGARRVIEQMHDEFLRGMSNHGDYGKHLRESATKTLIESVLPQTGVIL